MIPRDALQIKRSSPLGGSFTIFLKQGLELVDAGVENMQEVIKLLASEGGCCRLSDLLDEAHLTSLTDDDIWAVFETQLLPFIGLLSHENVLSSHIIETHHTGCLISFMDRMTAEQPPSSTQLYDALSIFPKKRLMCLSLALYYSR